MDGTLWACGSNSYGQLGDGSRVQRVYPAQVMNVFYGIAGNYSHSLLLSNDGIIRSWGHNSNGQLGDGTLFDRNIPGQVKLSDGTTLTNVISIAGGYKHTIALKNDGTVWTWGGNSNGQLGNGTTTDQKSPVQVKMASGTALTNIVSISGGGSNYNGPRKLDRQNG